MTPFLDKRGISLVAVIILLVFASVVIMGVTTFVIQRLSLNEIKYRLARGVDLAHAGVHQAIYFYREHDQTGHGYFSLGQTNVDANNFFVLGHIKGVGNDSDWLMVNTSATAFVRGNRLLRNFILQNATNSKTITIDRMVVSWVNPPPPTPPRRLRRIRFRRLSPIPSGWMTVWNRVGGLPTPVDANIINYTLDTVPSDYEGELRFNNTSGITEVNINFVMTDGSTRSLRIYPPSKNFNFTVKSMGKTVGSEIYRTIEAEYNAFIGRVIDYHEIQSQIVFP